MSRSGGGKKVKILIITIDDPIYIPTMIQNLVKISPSSLIYSSIVITPTKPRKMSLLQFISYQWGLLGPLQFTKLFLLYCFRKTANRLSRAEYSKKKIPIIRTDSLNNQTFLSSIREISPDIILSIASSRIFGKELLSIPMIACLNVHAGKLPRYRGVNPSFWSLLNQERESAISVHYMNEKIDDGDLIAQDVFDIEGMKSLHEVYQKILEIAPATVVRSLLDIEKGQINVIKNDCSAATYYSFPTREDGKKFRSMGLSFL